MSITSSPDRLTQHSGKKPDGDQRAAELKLTTTDLAAMINQFAMAFIQARRDLILQSDTQERKKIAQYTEATGFFTDLITWAESDSSVVESFPFLNIFFKTLGIEPERQQALKELIKKQVDLIEELLQSTYNQIEYEAGENVEKFGLKQTEFHQKLAAYFYLVLIKGSQEDELAATLLSTLSRALGQTRMPNCQYFGRFITGAEAQAAICHTLRGADFAVLLPDYDNEEELAQWDLNGVDLVAITAGGRILLIDAKGRNKRNTDVGLVRNTGVNIEIESVNPDHQPVVNAAKQHLTKLGKTVDKSTQATRLIVTVPTGNEFMGPLGRLREDVAQQLVRQLSQ